MWSKASRCVRNMFTYLIHQRSHVELKHKIWRRCRDPVLIYNCWLVYIENQIHVGARLRQISTSGPDFVFSDAPLRCTTGHNCSKIKQFVYVSGIVRRSTPEVDVHFFARVVSFPAVPMGG